LQFGFLILIRIIFWLEQGQADYGNQLTAAQSFAIYPNPADEIAFIDIINWRPQATYFVNIFDIAGTRMATINLQTNFKIT